MGGASSTAKYSACHIEAIFNGLRVSNLSYEALLDTTNRMRWDNLLYHYLHEFTHTAECYYPYSEIYDYHDTERYYLNNNLETTGTMTTLLYLLNQAIVDSEIVGIPHSYWQGVFKEYNIIYLATDGGYIEGEAYQLLSYLEEGTPVKAIANEGYRFQRWSDGKTTPERQIYSLIIAQDMMVTAIFEKIEE